MLPVKFRLKSKNEFDELFRKGKSLAGETLVMKYRSAPDQSVKIGFSAGLKFSKKAMQRNKAKRWMRESVSRYIQEISPGARIIFIVNSKVKTAGLSYRSVTQEVEHLLRKGKLL